MFDHHARPADARPAPPQLALSSGASSAASLHSGEFPLLPLSPTTLEQAAFLPGIARFSPGPNFQGSWLDLESDDEDGFTRRATLVRTRRKNSGSSMKEASSRSPLAGFRELTHRSSMHLRKLTVKMTR
ncbi:hypothetical protein IWQ56_004904 [Coemansia nantahalensis]|nr:hypothetical protein IWQ56_004904 [Coemansia nantahalensis]